MARARAASPRQVLPDPRRPTREIARLWPGRALCGGGRASPAHPRTLHVPMTVIALVLAGNLLLAGLFSLVAVALD
jgi:hypothetical protein